MTETINIRLQGNVMKRMGSENFRAWQNVVSKLKQYKTTEPVPQPRVINI